MTELDTATFVPPRDPPPATAVADAPPPRTSYSRQIVRITFGRIGARVGLGWIVLLVLFAVFAPVIANSHPLLMKQGGRWSSPMLRHLTAADVVLQVTFWTFVGLSIFRPSTLRTRALILLGVVAASSLLAGLTVHPPEPVVYDVYRRAARAGTIEAALYAPIRFSPDDHQRDQPEARLQRPSREHPMGTTEDAADLASNMIYASRIALSIGFVATGVAVVLGVVMGGVMGYFGGWVDLVGMRLVEIFESVPTLLLLLAFAGLFQSAGTAALYYMMAIIGFLGSFGYAEFVRADFLALRNRDYVHAAQAAGLPLPSILFRHMLPNALTPVIVNASFGVAGAILIESTLSFLGIGLHSEASWGNLLEQALGAGGSFFWWLALYPGMAIFLTVFSYNLIGEALRDALDPRLNKMA